MSASRIDGREVLARGQPVFGSMPKVITTGTDLVGPLCIMALATLGVFFIYSAQHFTGADFWLRQIVWLTVGACVYCAVAYIDYHFWFRYAHIIYFIGIILLLMLWSPMGIERDGSRRWLKFPGMSLQPSESAKISALIMVAAMLGREKLGTVRESLWALTKIGMVVSVPIFLIFLQPDLGSALVFGPMIFSLLYVSRLS